MGEVSGSVEDEHWKGEVDSMSDCDLLGKKGEGSGETDPGENWDVDTALGIFRAVFPTSPVDTLRPSSSCTASTFGRRSLARSDLAGATVGSQSNITFFWLELSACASKTFC